MYKEHKYFLSCSVNLDVMILISYIDLAQLNTLRDSLFVTELQQQIGSSTELRNSVQNEMFVSVQVFADGQPMHALPISTRNPPRCNGTNITWNEWITLPVKYKDLSKNASLHINIWAVGDKHVGSASCTFFNSKYVLLDGVQRLSIRPMSSDPTTLDNTCSCGENKLERESYRLDKLKEQYDRKEMIRNPWLDPLVFKQIAQIRQEAELPGPHDENSISYNVMDRIRFPNIWIEFPYFGHRVIYEEDSHASARSLIYLNDSKRSIVELSTATQSLSVKSFSSTPYRSTLGETSNSTTPSNTKSNHSHFSNERNALVLVFDPELTQENPVELKYRKLVRDILRGSIDPNLKPNREEKSQIESILANPNDDLRNEEKDLLWKFRFTLTDTPKAVTKFLLSVDWHDEQEVNQATELLYQWTEKAPIDIADALKLLGRQKEFKHDIVRQFAVSTLSRARNEELLDYLLQLVQALRYESRGRVNSIDSVGTRHMVGPLANFLVIRARSSFQMANYFSWYLKVEMGDHTEGELYKNVYDALISELESHPDSKQISEMLKIQEKFVTDITRCHQQACEDKGRKEQKEERLREHLHRVKVPKGANIRIPLDPSIQITGIVPSTACMFKSALYPAVIEFRSASDASHRDIGFENSDQSEHDSAFRNSISKRAKANKSVSRMSHLFGREECPTYKVMFKTGDDLRQDQLIMQMFILMDRLLKKVNLDLKLTPYRILATSKCDGLMEFVLNSHPVSKVVANYETPQILSFLRKHQPDPSAEFGVSPTALNTYVKSVAGYCVLTYLLGIGDRHLDNLMLKTEGHLFHIDFGCIFGRDPKPYPPPFKLTKEMVEGMGGPESVHYSKFMTYCCQAYNWLRKSASLILNLLSLMIDAGIDELSTDPVTTLGKVQEKFRLDLTDEQAEQFFLSLINDSVTALFPVLMEYIHKVATKLR